jgi:hypothetical protein
MTLLRHQFNWNYENDIAHMNARCWLARREPPQRFFLYAHYIDPHIPYDPPARYREEFAQDHGFTLFNERKRAGRASTSTTARSATPTTGSRSWSRSCARSASWDNTLFVFTSTTARSSSSTACSATVLALSRRWCTCR